MGNVGVVTSNCEDNFFDQRLPGSTGELQEFPGVFQSITAVLRIIQALAVRTLE